MIPSTTDELTPEWFTEALGEPVDAVEVLDAHSGTTGRARIGLTASSALPATVFVKLQPFVAEQRKFLRQIGLGVAEARLYAEVGNELPVRAPRVWHSDYDEAEGTFVMVLEDLEASGCRFVNPGDDDIGDVAMSAMDELAVLHAAYQGRDLGWLRTPSGMRSKPDDPEIAERRAQFVVSAVDQFADDMPSVFRRLGELYAKRSLDIVALFNEGERTLIHGDTHSGNLFVDAGRTGFFDWAVAGRGPGVRDVAYFLCNSLPVETRRAEGGSVARPVSVRARRSRCHARQGHRRRAVPVVLGLLVDRRGIDGRDGLAVAAGGRVSGRHGQHDAGHRGSRRGGPAREAARHLAISA